MKLLRDLESPLDKLDFLLRSRHALLRFLLESMKHEDRGAARRALIVFSRDAIAERRAGFA
jgi:hypothetical protein